MRTSRLWLLLAFSLPAAAFAQSELEAWRFSQTSTFGTARGQALGGAMSAVGADFSSAYLNPAGFGLYRRSEFTISPTLRSSSNDATFIGATANGTSSRFGIGQIAYVMNQDIIEAGKRRELGWKSWTLALGYTQTENYSRNTAVGSFNGFNSISNFFSNQANNGGVPRGIDAAFEAFFFDGNSTNGYRPYFNAIENGGVDQTLRLEEKGRTGQWTINVGANFSDRIFVGGSIGITDYNQKTTLVIGEFDTDGVYNDSLSVDTNFPAGSFSDLVFSDEYTTTGAGINFSVGIIAQATDFLRLSVAFHSPTFSRINVTYLTQAYLYDDSNFEYPGTFENSEVGQYSYNLTTPFRTTLGAMCLLGKFGFVSADVDFLNYSSARLASNSSADFDFTSTNDIIQEQSGNAINYRLGLELRLQKNFYLRGGYAGYGAVLNETGQKYDDASTVAVEYDINDPLYTATSLSYDTKTIDDKRTAYTGGLGFRGERFSIDLALVYQEQTDKYSLYSTSETQDVVNGYGVAPVVVNKDVITRAVLTLGLKLR